VRSQADVIVNVAVAGNNGVENTDVRAVVLPTQPALVQSEAPDAFPASAAVTTSEADGLRLATSNIAGVGDWSSPLVFAVADQRLSFVVRRPATDW